MPSAFAVVRLIDQLELGRLLDRDIARFRSAQNLVDIFGGTSEQVRGVWSIGHQTSRFDVLPRAVHRRQSRAQRQDVDTNAVGDDERVATDVECVRAALERVQTRARYPPLAGFPM